eukprot:4128646-Karenia_brevis.AAC.1
MWPNQNDNLLHQLNFFAVPLQPRCISTSTVDADSVKMYGSLGAQDFTIAKWPLAAAACST